MDSSEFTFALTRPSARGWHRHLLWRNIVGPITVHRRQERDSGNGGGDVGATFTMRARCWRWKMVGRFSGETRSRYHIRALA